MFFEHVTWTSFELTYVITQIFVAIGTCFVAIFSAWVAYKAYKETRIDNWLDLEFAYLINNTKNNITSLCLNLRNNGKMPIRISHAVMFFLGSNKIIDNIYFNSKHDQEVGIFEMLPLFFEPVRIKQASGEVKNNFDVIDFYSDKIKNLDIDKIKRIRIGIVTNIKYYKYQLSEEEIYNMLKYLREYKSLVEGELLVKE